MNACDNKLKSSLVEAMKLDNARLEKELQHSELHVFSPDFERRMERLIKIQRSKSKIQKCFRYIAAAVMVEEEITYFQIHYKYENELGDNVTIRVSRGAGTISVDNEFHLTSQSKEQHFFEN
ncbi:MAG: hypothetical protein IKK03_12925 [Lachnospiraceae bacterium]|nr:hypothetical protein [Lachnospiraceae bacterium]